MRREGRQHGCVRTHVILSEPGVEEASEDGQRRSVKNKMSGMPVAGVFAKVSRKPTNHSKFTGKCSTQMCASCRDTPVSKAKSKAKGTRKLKLMDDEAQIDIREAMDDDRQCYELSDALLDDIAYGAL